MLKSIQVSKLFLFETLFTKAKMMTLWFILEKGINSLFSTLDAHYDLRSRIETSYIHLIFFWKKKTGMFHKIFFIFVIVATIDMASLARSQSFLEDPTISNNVSNFAYFI